VSLGGGYSKSTYSIGYSQTRKYGLGLSYNFTNFSSVEFYLSDQREDEYYGGFSDSKFHDRVFSLSWNQNLTDRRSLVQPYFKLGVAQLNRDNTVIDLYTLGRMQETSRDVLTLIGGLGLRILLFGSVSVRIDGTSYFTGEGLGSWSENFSVTYGLSYLF
jgi:hypothetical protein